MVQIAQKLSPFGYDPCILTESWVIELEHKDSSQNLLHRRVVQRVQKRYPSSELLAAGWSLGGNILVRYLGEEGANSPISAAASLCNPLDLVHTSLP